MALTLAPHTFIMANGHQAAAAVLSGGQSWPARLVTPNISPSWSPQYFIILTSIFPHPGYSNISPSWSPPIFPHTSHLNISPTDPLQCFPTLVTPIFAHSSHLNIYHRFCFLPLLNFRQADAAQYRFVKGDFNWDKTALSPFSISCPSQAKLDWLIRTIKEAKTKLKYHIKRFVELNNFHALTAISS